ncbi:MAG: molybdopterin molybdotransferase MoeA [Methanobacteriaceae archaeon]
MFLSELIPLKEAKAIVRNNQIVMATESINLEDAYLRVLSGSIKSFHNSPAFDKSAMDGFALKGKDTFGASQESTKKFKIIDTIGAGSFSNKNVGEFEAVKIATGAPIPDGADAVIMEEYTYSNDTELEIFAQVSPQENVAFCGEDIRKGDKALDSNTILRAQELGIIASSGFANIEVYKKPNVAIIITGNELVEPSDKLDKAKTINSNKYMIKAMVESCGAIPTVFHCEDDLDLMKKSLETCINDYDLVITTGGTAISKGDVVVDAVAELGEVLFHGLAVRPGKPVGFGKINNTSIFMLSGYPVAAMGQFDMLAREYLFKMQNVEYSPKIEKKVATGKIFSNLGHTDYIRANAGENEVKYILNRGSGIIRSMVEANSYIIIEENQEGVAKGETVDVLFFENMNFNK